jgi:site-specific DNA recombinase
MEKLDRLVTERLAGQLLTPERVGKLLLGLMERQSARDEDHVARVTAPRTKLADAKAISDGSMLQSRAALPIQATQRSRSARRP